MSQNIISEAGKSTTKEVLEALKAMNLLAKLCNDEGFYYNHWIYVIPDEADDDELLDIAEDDSDAVRCFINKFHKYAQDGGLYIGGERWPD